MQNPVISTLEEVMHNPAAYLIVLLATLFLAPLIVGALQTLLAMRARVIVPLLRVQSGQQFTTIIAPVGTIDAVLCPHCASSFDHQINVNPMTVTQPREAL